MKKIDVKKSTIFSVYEDDTDLKLGIRGYFSHYSNFETYTEGELEGFTYSEYMTTEQDPDGDYGRQWYDYFIPKDKVVFKEEKEKPKKLRPYKTREEFPVGIGSVLTYRSKDNPSTQIFTIIQAIATTEDDKLVYVYMDGVHLTPLHLLKDYEYLNVTGDEWLPFGVEE